MRILFTLLLTLLLAIPTLYAQVDDQYPPLVPLTAEQQEKMAAIPQAQWPVKNTKSPTVLPISVDNSALSYFRPLFTQSGLECGQASSIGLGLTYELNAKRGLPGNVSQNQMATYFTYDFLNGGSDAGVCALESWEIVKRCGNPSVFDYGGLSSGGASRWMSGYNLYYNAMHNRITDVATIYLNTTDGWNMMRSWIYNHMDQASLGGVGTFYSQYGAVNNQLPSGTPEGGKYVITSWGSSPNHSMTIVGYNDSIRWDYNGDGQYTNNVDINGDGIVNMRDWEIGGFKIANTYGNVGNWANQGFAWATYKSFAEFTSSGGIWNNAAFIPYAKQDLSPKLTMKIALKHTSRNKLRVIAGVANNLSATEPEVTLSLPIMDFQGGDKYMQGGTTEADKTIEFGVDATPLLSETNNGQPAKYFLMVQENDPSNSATGQVVSFDLIDYTTGSVTIPSGSSNVPLVENGTTTLTVNAALSCSKPDITNTVLPDAKIYEPYSQQLFANGGTAPYKWRMAFDYTETASTATIPSVTGQQLSVNDNYAGFGTLTLPFAFPFYGKTYTKIYPDVDGYIKFDDHPTPWPYIIYENTFFKNNRCISPYMGKPLIVESGDGDGIWYESSPDSVTIRWKLSVYGIASSTDINFAVRLYPDGRIKYFYGNINSTNSIRLISGISNGDGMNYHFTSITDSIPQPTPNSTFLFNTLPYPTEMSLSETGVFSGNPQKTYSNVPIRFYVEDNNFLHKIKTLYFNTKGVEISYQIVSGNDSIIEYGENVFLTPTLKNVSSTTLHNVVMHLTVDDPAVTMIDSTEFIGQLAPGQVLTFQNAFHFTVSNFIENGQMLNLYSQVIAAEDNFNRTINLPAWSADLAVTSVAVADGNNNILMPGENGNLLVTLRNNGGSKATNLSSVLATIDPYLSILQASSMTDTLFPSSETILTYQVHANSNCPPTHIGFFTLNTSGDKDISLQDSLYINIGPLVEDFETGTFTRFPWQNGGNANWSITNSSPYEGLYSAQSGTIIDNQESSLFATMEVLCGADISFYRKVSSEPNYDYLYFYIDGTEMGKWSGAVSWDKVTYPVTAGVHTFKWVYKKDYSISTGSDKAWIDYISWPPLANFLLVAYAGPDDIACSGQGYSLGGEVMNAASVWWSTSGDGTFTSNNSPNATYTPGINDLNNGLVTLTIHASQGSISPVTDEVTLTVIQGPVANAGPDASVCPGAGILLSGATAQFQASVHWTSSGDGVFDDPNILNPLYSPGANDLLAGSVVLTITATGNTECNPVSDAMYLSFSPTVISNAGNDLTIPYNTSAQLNGSATGGFGSFTAFWEPASLFVDPTSFTPTTIPLTSTQVFTLTATNTQTGCSSSDQVVVTVTGGPLSVIASASPSSICLGGSSQLTALGSGGSGVYTYTWTSDPPGFTSTLPNPTVTPTQSTTYTVMMNDGFAIVNSQTSVSVFTFPSVPAQPQGPVAVNVIANPATTYTTTNSSNSIYSWGISPETAGSLVQNGASCTVNWSPVFDGTAALWVTASNLCGISAPSESLNITANALIGLPESETRFNLNLYPNPTQGKLNVHLPNAGAFTLNVSNNLGMLMQEFKVNVSESRLDIELDLSLLPSGLYYLKAKIGEKSANQKFVIMK